MYLKNLELFGFKSFAEKAELDLSPGITAIIGPNGCGKSNLVDAVRWALGEQSVKSLRGHRMEEVIFSGSENRKALNFAEVSLTFAGASSFLNFDYDEVTIARRLFRNGESEYYINKSSCRLKDVTELFIDTGLGKDVYSVIGQGRVDEIINNRPDERREIFEEAAGILKYKIRKGEARRRLDETRDNLVRVQDLIFELENQVEPLQKQAEITRQYRELRRQIETEERKLLTHQLTKSREQLNKVNKQLQDVNDSLVSSAAEGGMHEKEIQDLKNSLQEEQKRKKEQERKLSEVSRTLEQQENEVKLLEERENRYQEQIEQNHQRVKQLEMVMEEMSAQKSRTKEELAEKKEALAQLEQELEDLREEMNELDKSALPDEVEKQQERIYQTGSKKEAAHSTIDELKRRLERIEGQKKNLQEEKAELQDKLNQLDKKAASLEELKENLAAEFSEDESLERKKVEEKETLQKELENHVEDERRKKEDLHGINSRFNLLQEQDTALTGYYRGVREVMEARASLPGIIGPVADLIEVDQKYVQAIESSLGGALQYLVAETEKSVHAAINYLKKGNRGWATFLPLDILHRASDPLKHYPGWNELEGVVGKASELVTINPSYQRVVDYLMSAILVCNSLENASKAARFVKHSCRVVTLEGEMINPGGIIRGGSVSKRHAGMPLGRRKEIESLQGQLASAKDELASIEAHIKEVRSKLTEKEKEVKEVSAKRHKVAEQLGNLQKEINQLQNERSVIDGRLKSGQSSIHELQTEESEINQRLEKLKGAVDSYSREIEELESDLAGKKGKYQEYLENKRELEQKITAILVRISSHQEQREALANRIEEAEQNINKPAEEIKEKEQEDEQLKQKLADNREQQKRINEKIEELNEEKASLISGLYELEEQVNQKETELIDLEEKGKRRQNQVTRQEKKEKQLSVEQTRLQTEINYQEMRFRELFNNLVLAQLDDDFDPEESSRIVENLKEDLEALGEVNLGAIEELERLEERINFLKDQKNDLQEGEASLCKVLNEIDQRMEYYFRNAFDEINEHFKQTFEELFEGGQVMLKLTDSENILDAGIEIIAQPPGKKLQNITLLSAGEKVLTAIALVFAILRFKPAPFYLLDEVESTLDDANLARFLKFLKQSSSQAQFIMITHRKRTMEEAERLYGVTMPEPGISRLVSLKLDDEKITMESK
ncbi:MAG: chromosome segregation protein SMC [Bacillota bacterium]